MDGQIHVNDILSIPTEIRNVKKKSAIKFKVQGGGERVCNVTEKLVKKKTTSERETRWKMLKT